ncbi:MAG: sodium:solute symporter family protein [Syntrophales bacterium]|jgi:SSS family solute:Na+ symporter|nr:sodium:solute symporter family protein [Syntrophales bacterium]MDY0045312.1 sodium:solute symporter family protein [Syntrophales bacterium]
MNINVAVIGVFFIVMIILGIYSVKKIRGQESYFVADRKGGILIITGSLTATALGGSSTIGLAGLGYSKGVVGSWWLLVGAIGMAACAFFLTEKVRRTGAFTLPEILKRQYGGNSARIAASILIVTAWVGIIAAQMVAAGKILNELWPGQFEMLTVVAAAIFIVYTVLGGQYSILRTDAIQAIIIVAGIFICLAMGLSSAGGSIWQNLPESHLSFPTSAQFSWKHLLSFLFFVGAAYLVGPDIYSRILSSKDSGTARISLLISAFILSVVAFAVIFIGLAAHVLLPGIQAESAFPALVMKLAPAGINGLVMAALIAAVMSSADTCLLTAGTIIASDILGSIDRYRHNEKKVLLLSRAGVVVIGLFSLYIALAVKGIIASLLLAYTIYSAGLVIPIVLGFYRKSLRLTETGAIFSIIGGGAAGLFFKLKGFDNLLLWTLPISAVLLFAGSYWKPAMITFMRKRNGST